MRRQARALVLVALAAVAAAGMTSATPPEQSYYGEHVERLVASPGPVPVAGSSLLSDVTTFRVDLDPGVVVQVDADENQTALFYLRYHDPGGMPQGSPLPSLHETLLLEGPGTWMVDVDPAAGVGVDIFVQLRGFVGDPDGGVAAPFALSETVDIPCLAPGACLP